MKKHEQGEIVKTDTPLTEKEKFKGIVFDDGLGDDPITMLENARSVTRFLIDINPAMQLDAGELTDYGYHGLYLILTGIENTISAAADCIAQ